MAVTSRTEPAGGVDPLDHRGVVVAEDGDEFFEHAGLHRFPS